MSDAVAKNSVCQTALLIVANCAGAGILSLPKAMNQAGLWSGCVLTVGAAILSAHTADILGRCYSLIDAQHKLGPDTKLAAETQLAADIDILEEMGQADQELAARSVNMRQTTSFFARSPYAAIGNKAVGWLGAAAVTIAQVLTQFCVLVLFFLISGINLNKLIPQRSSLFFSLICTVALAPLMLLRPGHVWATAVFAIIASVVLIVVIFLLCITGAEHDPYTPPPTVTYWTFGTAFGVILFGFGGHAILPALQATLADPTPVRFRQAIIFGFVVCTTMYLISSISSVLTLGGAVGDDVLTSFDGWLNSIGLGLVTAHLLFAAVTVHIPLGQIMDHYAGARDCGARQIFLRVVTMGLVALMIWLIGDHFFCFMGIVGATCNNAMIFIFPPWFYLKLLRPEQRTLVVVAKMTFIMAIGTAGMVSALIGAVKGC